MNERPEEAWKYLLESPNEEFPGGQWFTFSIRHFRSRSSIWKRCSTRWNIGVSMIPVAVTKTNPEKSAYAEANTLDASEVNAPTGPIPVRIIDAFSNASTHSKPAMK